ncbi:MAG: hypothetical protein NW226_22645 [Microscillaceae bacterium]|nr:hypothetical protein [Microscillaceae bacterium]
MKGIIKSEKFDTELKEQRYLERFLGMDPNERLQHFEQLCKNIQLLVGENTQSVNFKAMFFERDFKDFILLLNRFEAEYLIIGGYATAVHGYVRATGDIDFWVNPTEENAEKLLKIMILFGYEPTEIEKADFLKTPNVLMFGASEINLLTAPDGLDSFADAYSRHLLVTQEWGDLYFIGLDDLIRNKEAVGREKDKIDLRQLKKIRDINQGKK